MSYRSNDAIMKRLNIDQETPKRMNKQDNSPSVVARLMGMDALPSQKSSSTRANEHEDERKDSIKLSKSDHEPSLSSSSIRMRKQDTGLHNIKKEHPQEELLQKFKIDFEAWQRSKAWEQSRTRTLQTDEYLHQTKVNQILAQENLNKEKMARCWESKRGETYRKPPKPMDATDQPKNNCVTKNNQSISETRIVILRHNADDEPYGSCSPELSENEVNMQDFLEEVKERLRSDILGMSTKHTTFGTKKKQSTSETRLVISRPNMDDEAYGSCSPELSENEVDMQDFLEKVKERLESDILGISAKHTTFSKSPENTKQKARHIAEQIEEHVTRDLDTSLTCSASSAGSHRSEVQCSRPEFPGRQKNFMRSGMLERVKSRTMHDFLKSGKKSHRWEDKKPTTESIGMIGERRDMVFDAQRSSPRNLARSFSAPISNGSNIHRQHKASKYSSPKSRRKRIASFNFKGTVSTLRQNLTFKGLFFGKKAEFHVVDGSAPNEFDSSKALATMPSLVVKVGSVEDNSTEVPPSPASLSGSSLDEFCRPGVPSPISPLPLPFIEDHSAAEVFTDNCTIIPGHCQYEEAIEIFLKNEAVEVEGHAKAYIREILITAGLYEEQVFEEAFPDCHKSKKLIPKRAFHEVEEAYRQKGRLDEVDHGSKICRKLLFDLTSEALPRVLKPTRRSWLKKDLLDCLWWEIQTYIKPESSESSSIDNMMAEYLRADPWYTAVHEDIYVTAKKLEIAIFEGLIYEFMSEVMSL